MSVVERIWYGDDPAAAASRVALWPFAMAYEGTMRLRASLYDAGVLPTKLPDLPAISVGNLTVGGTGKTPVAAWLGTQLSAKARPAIVLRGYGQDEMEVHARLNPDIIVVASADRVQAIAFAKRDGADCVVLDDAFQHRRVGRVADVILLSAEQMLRPRRLLPAGPWREPISALRRADLVIVTRKAADLKQGRNAMEIARQYAPDVPMTLVHLAPANLTDPATGETVPLEHLRSETVLAIAAIGEPELFARQLQQLGARVNLAAYRDHYAFMDRDASELAQRAGKGLAVCTLKDAVKLVRRWPGPSRLWYLSQQLVVDQGVEHVTRLIERVLNARTTAATSAG